MNNPIFNMMRGAPAALPINPQLIQLAQAMKGGANPQAIMAQMIQSNPQFAQFANARPGDLKSICERLCRERGIDLDATIQQINNMMK